MIVLKAPQDHVLHALQAMSGIVERRHTLPILADVLVIRRNSNNLYDDYVAVHHTRMTPVQTPLAFVLRLTESVGTSIKLAFTGSLGLIWCRVRKQSGFFCASKVNARNAP